jgi:WS/DGAT/MGAT family acyltransferase
MKPKMIPPMDLMFFLTESPQSPKHVGALQIFELPPDAPDTYLVDLVKAFKQAPVAPPFNYHPHFPRFGLPQWREDDDLEIDYHVRHSALPKPGTNQQLMAVVQRLHSSLLDRRRPGWICQVIEGLEGNRFAIYSKIHHAYIDGKSGVKRMYGSLSSSATDQTIIPSWSFQPEKTPVNKPAIKAQPKAGNKLARQVTGAVEAYEFFSRMGMQWLKLRDSKAQIPFSATRTRMNRSIDWDTRSAAVCTLPLDRVKAVGKAKGCTVNEVVLAVIGAALHDYLEQHRENTRHPLVALCPMSIRAENDDSATTQVSAVHVRLGEPDASIVERLEQVIDSSHASKQEVQGMSNEAMVDYGVIIFALWELLSRTKLDQVVSPSYNVLVSNVPGPGDEALYLCGSLMLSSFPISTLLPGVNLNTTLLSHGNKLDFGLLGDMHALPDLDIVAQQMILRFDELQLQVLGKPRARASKKSTTAKKTKAGSRTRSKSVSGSATRAKARPKRRVG